MEDATVFNAGRGSALARDGSIEMDAGIMDGFSGQTGAVSIVKTFVLHFYCVEC